MKDVLHCICRELNDESKPMIRCDVCKKWFHKKCMKVDCEKDYTHEQWDCDLLLQAANLLYLETSLPLLT